MGEGALGILRGALQERKQRNQRPRKGQENQQHIIALIVRRRHIRRKRQLHQHGHFFQESIDAHGCSASWTELRSPFYYLIGVLLSSDQIFLGKDLGGLAYVLLAIGRGVSRFFTLSALFQLRTERVSFIISLDYPDQ